MFIELAFEHMKGLGKIENKLRINVALISQSQLELILIKIEHI